MRAWVSPRFPAGIPRPRMRVVEGCAPGRAGRPPEIWCLQVRSGDPGGMVLGRLGPIRIRGGVPLRARLVLLRLLLAQGRRQVEVGPIRLTSRLRSARGRRMRPQ